MYRLYTTVALIACLTSACATAPSTGGTRNNGAECRRAINDVTRYCEGKELNRRRCDGAKEASRKACI